MLNKINFEVVFGSTGKTLKAKHDFSEGLTAITGPNESGKSMRLEMVRFALFGTKALRSAGSSYKSLNVELNFVVGDVVYRVERKKSNATLYNASSPIPIATGTTPVNAAIERIFGYNLSVFDAANAVLQGEVEALSKMGAPDRKRMVDRVVGLDAIDDIVKEVTAEMSGQRMVVESLERSVVPDVDAPEMPDDYMVSDEVQKFIDSTTGLVIEKQRIETMTMALNCDHPGEEPAAPLTNLDNLYELQAERNALAQNIKRDEDLLRTYQNLKPVEGVEGVQEYLDEMGPEQWKNFYDTEALAHKLTNAMPEEKKEEIEEFIQLLNALPAYNKIKELEAHMVQCPECKAEFPLMQSAIEGLKKEIPQSLNVESVMFRYEQTLFFKHNAGVKDLKGALDSIEHFQRFLSLPEVPKPSMPDRNQSRTELQKLLNSNRAYTVAQEAIPSVLKYMEPNITRFNELFAMNIPEAITQHVEGTKKLLDWKAANQKYQKFQAYIEETKDWLKNLMSSEDDLQKFRAQYNVSLQFENDVETWKTRTAQNEKAKADLSIAKGRLDELSNVRKALNDLKPRVKLYLVPSLNRVASNLLSQMTNGQRNIVNVNEEFEITIDNQPIDELSGSAKAVANLAIRIGLGTVLTSRVFSVLLADEVDASMDPERSEYTAQCLRNLTSTFKQVILVSHREPEADHHIKV